MREHKGFTLIELLVVIAIIALLMSILMPALNRVSDQAKNAVCRSNLHQFAIAWKLFLDDNQNKFPEGSGDWVSDTFDYYRDKGLLVCPYAKKTKSPVVDDGLNGGPEHAWGRVDDGVFIGSVGLNELCSSDTGGDRLLEELYVNATTSQAYRAPLMGDCANQSVTPQIEDFPPEWDGQIYDSLGTNQNEIRSFCINRHVEKINLLFLDWSVRPVGLKELWIIKWTRNWEMTPETLPPWPDWMLSFPDPYASL